MTDRSPSVLIAVDLIGVPRAVTDEVAQRLAEDSCDASSSSSAPRTRTPAPRSAGVLPYIFNVPASAAQQQAVDSYTSTLIGSAGTRRARGARRSPAVAGFVVAGPRRLRGEPPRAQGREMDRVRRHARRRCRSRRADAGRSRPGRRAAGGARQLRVPRDHARRQRQLSARRLAGRRQGADSAAASGRDRHGDDRDGR